MASILNSDIYELCDLREALDNKDYKLAEKITMQFVEAAALIIDNTNPFISTFINETNSHRHIDYQLPAPAAVMVSTDGKSSYFNLYLNPIIICEIFKDHENKFFNHFAALMRHEMMHLIFNHQSEEQELFDKTFIKKYHQLTNICQDAKINTTKEIVDDEWVKATGVTYKSLKENYKSFKISEKQFKKSNWIELFKEIKDEYSENYDKQQQLIQNLQNAINDLMNATNQNGSSNNNGNSNSDNNSQGSSQNGDKPSNGNNGGNSSNNNKNSDEDNDSNGNNGKKSIKELEEAVKQALDALSEATGGNIQIALGQDIQIGNASKVQAQMAIEDVLNETIVNNDLTEDEIKSRGLLPGPIANQLFHKDKDAEAIDITRYYRKGINKILKQTKPNRYRLKLRTSNFSLRNSQKHDRGKEVIAYIDTSGSIDPSEINFFLTQLYETTKKYNISLTAIPFDYDCHHESAVKIDSKFKFNFPCAGGGTRASSAFEDMKEQNYSPDSQFVIILTDGYIEDKIEKDAIGEYEHDVLWVIDDKSVIDDDYDKAQKQFPGDIAYITRDKKFMYAFPDKVNVN